MDGSNRSVIVEDRITWPNGLTLDFINDRIYWADAREDYIQFASLDGTNRHTGREHAGTLRGLTPWTLSQAVSEHTLFTFVCVCVCVCVYRSSPQPGHPPHLCHDAVRGVHLLDRLGDQVHQQSTQDPGHQQDPAHLHPAQAHGHSHLPPVPPARGLE